jgi:hypothetical protein
MLVASSFAGAGASAQTPASTFANAGAIMINDLATATPYPSVVNVSGLTGSLVKVTLQLNRFNHTCPFDVAMALVAPNGTWIVPMNSAGGCLGATDVNLQFADGFLNLPEETVSGTYSPTNFGAIEPPPDNLCGAGTVVRPDHTSAKLLPAPATAMSAFNGPAATANGAWSLYVADCVEQDFGNIAAGWSLTFTTMPAGEETAIIVPTLGQAGLAALIVLVLGAGIVVLRRRGYSNPTNEA